MLGYAEVRARGPNHTRAFGLAHLTYTMRHSVYFRFYILSFQLCHSVTFKIEAETNKLFEHQSIDIRMLMVSKI